MDLIISGMSLSYQWWPSLAHFEESLPEKRDSSPALVEQAGEVICQALRKAQIQNGSSLTIIYDSDQIELGHYLPLLSKDFRSIEQEKPRSKNLLARIKQAAELIDVDPDRRVVICELSLYGSAAIVLSSPDNNGAACVRLKSAGSPGLEPSLADYAVLSDTSGIDQERVVTLLQKIFQGNLSRHPVALGCGSANAQSPEISTFIQTVLSIQQKIIPACAIDLDQIISRLSAIPIHSNKGFRPWLARGPGYSRSSLFLFQDQKAQDLEYIVLEEVEQSEQTLSVRIVSGSDPYLFPISGESKTEIFDRLSLLEDLVLGPGSLLNISNIAYTKFYDPDNSYVLSLLASNRDQLDKEIMHSKSGVSKAFQTEEDWTSPFGSYFTANSLGSTQIAFVYPGAFNSYPGMAKELFFSFPGLHDAAQQIIPDLSHSLAEDFVYLRSSRSGQDDSENKIMEDFYQQPGRLIESGISLSVLHTLILDQVFKVKPNAALGYSLGEISMLWANQIWQNAEARSDSWRKSSLFKDELVGEMKTVRKYWHDKELDHDFWRSFILKTNSDQAQAACDQEPMAYLSIKNTPDEVVIVGEKEACQRVINNLNCRALPMPFNAVIHNPTMQASNPSFVDLYDNNVNPRTDISFYSAADYQKLDLKTDGLAQKMALMTCNPVDFTRLVNQVYDDGARIFIEVGPQKTCSRWIEKILQDKPHAVIPINKKYQQDFHGVLKVIAMLLSHGVELDLSHLYPTQELTILAEKNGTGNNWVQEDPEIKPTGILDHHTADQLPEPLLQVYFDNLELVSADLAKSHSDYLKTQQTMTRNLARLMKIQAGSPPAVAPLTKEINTLYTREQIEAFTLGDHRLCFGDSFSGFEDRRIPRLPNGDLQFIDRVIQIGGQPEVILEGSTLVSEFDLPDQAWYKNGSRGSLPYVSIMELALQPCGFLSAYMGTIKGRESQDLYFRNLDGEGTLFSWPESPDKTITNQVRLLSSSSLEDVIIQNYAFELTWGGKPFYKGTSSFGYFPLAMLENQAGLDAGRKLGIWQNENPTSGEWHKVQTIKATTDHLKKASLPGIDEVWISLNGGKYSRGYLYSRQTLRADAWFYKAHFYQDPVMPGSLGVETMTQAMISSIPAWDLPGDLNWKIKPNGKTSWKYRGQITPDIRDFEIELHFKQITQTSEGWEISADGLLWKDSKPIYQVDNITLAAQRSN